MPKQQAHMELVRGDKVKITIPNGKTDPIVHYGVVEVAVDIGHRVSAWHVSLRNASGALIYWTQPLDGGYIEKE